MSKTMKALVEDDKEGTASVQSVPIPTISGDEILVKVDYVAQNPTDWKHVKYISPPKAIIGCDFTGIVVEVPSGEAHKRTHVKVGTRVAGCVHGGYYTDRGSFAEYLKVPADLAWVVPDNMTPEHACTFGVPYYTAFHALVVSQKAPWPPAKEGTWILIYGGSSAVGLFALQLAKFLGYKVVTTASPHNHELVKSYGADAVFDYKSSDAIEEIKKVTGGGVDKALDCISEAATNEFTAKCFGPNGGQLNVILSPAGKVPENVKFAPTLLYTWFGKPFEFGIRGQEKAKFPVIEEDVKAHKKLVELTPEYLELGAFKAPPIQNWGGIEDINAGFAKMEQGKNSGHRIVYKIA